jgi:hypothetical protein
MRKRYGSVRLVLTVGILLGAAPAFGDEVTLTLVPASGSVAGPPGSTVGWGYTITNNTAEWIQTMSLSSDPFLGGTPNQIFDFPAVDPDSSVTLNFSLTATASCAFPPCGLYELTWDSMAPQGLTTGGTFTIASDFFSAQPGTPGATDLGPAPDENAAYSATVSSTTVIPEPSSLILLLTCLGVLLLRINRPAARYCGFRFLGSPASERCRRGGPRRPKSAV